MLLELENLQHRALPKQPDCLTVQLYEHQKQDAQWMMDQEMLKGGSMQHLWAELPPHPHAVSYALGSPTLLWVVAAPSCLFSLCLH